MAVSTTNTEDQSFIRQIECLIDKTPAWDYNLHKKYQNINNTNVFKNLINSRHYFFTKCYMNDIIGVPEEDRCVYLICYVALIISLKNTIYN